MISRFSFRYSPALTVLGHVEHDDAICPVVAVDDSAAIAALSKLSRRRVTLSQVGSEATRSRLLATPELGVADIVFIASPAVANDGGDIRYRGFRNGVVYLAMQGACSGCPSSTATLKQGIEGLLKHYVPEVTEVRAA